MVGRPAPSATRRALSPGEGWQRSSRGPHCWPPAVTSTVPLDLAASPRDNLYAFGKTWGRSARTRWSRRPTARCTPPSGRPGCSRCSGTPGRASRRSGSSARARPNASRCGARRPGSSTTCAPARSSRPGTTRSPARRSRCSRPSTTGSAASSRSRCRSCTSVPVSEHLVEHIGVAPGDRVLDVAIGTGHVALAAARRSAEAVGMDYVPELLEIARRRAAAEDLVIRFDGRCRAPALRRRVVRHRPVRHRRHVRRGPRSGGR